MNLRHLTLLLTISLSSIGLTYARDCKNDSTYIVLRDSMSNAFNLGDSARFNKAITKLENYLLQQDDLHLYYTQRCNEIIFLMNSQNIFEAYKKAQTLSKELREKGLDKEMYMAKNMMGHIYRYCGNHEAAKKAFNEVIELMEKYGYYESMPPIYMNIVNVEMDDDPDEAIEMLEKAAEIARKYSPDRLFDIESRRLLSYYNQGDMEKFVEGYKVYKAGVDSGQTSVHGRAIEIYYEAYMGDVDKAIKMAKETLGDDANEITINLYKNAGRWQEAYEALRIQLEEHDSIDNVILSNSMKGIEDELQLYEIERQANKERLIGMISIIAILILLICALSYIVFIRRQHMKQLKIAYERALESDNIKTAFIRNVSHEVRTPLNIIAGFAQIVADTNIKMSPEELKDVSQMVLKNTNIITNHFDELIELSLNEHSGDVINKEDVDIHLLIQQVAGDYKGLVNSGVELLLENGLPEGFTIATNKKMIARMVNLLLDNANKNTTTGNITIKTSTKGATLEIAVQDTGCGVDAKEAERIFERFVKLDNFKEGLGLGLPLCRMIAHRIGGNVYLDTTFAGPGARFVITLPL
ncbi:tetratricopeptide repeat-containing sensor histidine kinase [Prevotella sp. E2-28]|uniref:tetratricopeptide repeat-containing sensor histidine kinase n=1 Tax=Prevotella sp. E2-28 TaxID=2913620 RepID=UPI001EDBFAFC|nr:tetratricopeptide repeat-containing sensor histidine kinase [Prevotella sp. E2-28]UKK53132.1 tetratricopeptide repeat-containing sensor histidine kinase [Prevotella sp. E2-28]